MIPPVLMKTDLPLPLFIRGKVRDTYDLGSHLLIVATDRISAFDVVLPTGIPLKGQVLNQLSSFWFRRTADIMPNHMTEAMDDVHSLDSYLPDGKPLRLSILPAGSLDGGQESKTHPVECVVRGYLPARPGRNTSKRALSTGKPCPAACRKARS